MKKDLSYYSKLKYEMHIRYDDDDKSWFVSFSDLPGCLADGVTPLEAFRNAERVKNEWIKSALEEGWEVPEPSPQIEVSGRLTFRPSKSIHQRLVERAEAEGISINKLLTIFAVQGLERDDAKEVIKKAADEQIKKCMVLSTTALDLYSLQPFVEKASWNQVQKPMSQWQNPLIIQTKGDKEHEGYKGPNNN